MQLTIDREALSVLKKLQEATNQPTMAAVLRDALGVYDGLHTALSESPRMKLALVGEGVIQELRVPSLEV